MKVLALRGEPYDITDDDTGRNIKGVSLTVVSQNDDPGQNGGFGHKPMKFTLDISLLPALQGKLPAICDVDFELKAGAGGKAAPVITAITVQAPFDLKRILKGAA